MYAQPSQHALARIDGVMNRVQADVATVANVLDLDHDQSVDVLQILADDVLSMSVIVPLDHQVATGSHANLVRYVILKDELAVVPLDVHLIIMSVTAEREYQSRESCLPFCF